MVQRERRLTRRQLLRLAALGGVGVVAALPARRGGAALAGPARDAPAEVAGFPVLTVSGSHRAIGAAMGRTFRGRILAALLAQPSFSACVGAARGPLRARVAACLDAARARFPHLVEELEGLAEGAGVPFPALFAWNCRSEIGAALDPCPPGCSTIGVAGPAEPLRLAHNEDGDAAYLGRMFVLRARPPSGVAFATLVYPGTLPGNGPGLNERGVVQTTNYIGPCAPADGVPRYVLGRAVLEAADLDEALAMATSPDRAFPWHHNLAWLPEGRLLSVETWPGRHHVRDVAGLHLHTNHLVHPEMADLPERRDYLDRSSLPRLAALERVARERPLLGRDDLLAALRDHDGEPCHVCRHPGDAVPGVTVGAALFEAPQVAMTLVGGPPCRGATGVVRP